MKVVPGPRNPRCTVCGISWTLASANVLTTFLIEADGDRYTVTNISEATGRDGNVRRRWLELDCIRADED